MNGVNQENSKLILKAWTPWWCVDYRLFGAKSQDIVDWVFQIVAESWIMGGEVRVINHFSSLEDSSEVCLGALLVWFHGKAARRSFHFRAPELKHNWGQDATCSLPEVQTQWLLVRSGLLYSAAHFSGKRLGLWGVKREMISRART